MSVRVNYIDRLKGFAILAVIMGHLSIFSFGTQEATDLLVSTFHMPVFMFLSGLVISAPPTVKKLLVKLPTFLCPFLLIGSLFVFSCMPGSNLFSNNVKFGYWYLYVLSIYYVLLSTFMWISRPIGKKSLVYDVLWAVLIFGVIILLRHIFNGSKYTDVFSILQLYYYWPWFVGGYLARKYNWVDGIFSNNLFFTVSFISYVVLSVFFCKGHYNFFMLTAAASIATFLYLFKRRENKSSFIEEKLALFGKNSLDIYIYHFFFVVLMDFNQVGDWIENTHNYVIGGIIQLAISVVLAYLCILIGNVIRCSEVFCKVIYGKFVS